MPSHEVSLTVPVLEYGAEECAAFQVTPRSKLPRVPSYPMFQVTLPYLTNFVHSTAKKVQNHHTCQSKYK